MTAALKQLQAAGLDVGEAFTTAAGAIVYHVAGEGFSLYVADDDAAAVTAILERPAPEPEDRKGPAAAGPTVAQLVDAIAGAASFDDAKQAIAAAVSAATAPDPATQEVSADATP